VQLKLLECPLCEKAVEVEVPLITPKGVQRYSWACEQCGNILLHEDVYTLHPSVWRRIGIPSLPLWSAVGTFLAASVLILVWRIVQAFNQ